MDKSDLELLYAYNRWGNAKVLVACQALTPEQMVMPVQVSFGSLMGTLAHILSAEMLWRKRMQEGVSPERMLTGADFTSLDQLAETWQGEEAAMQGFVASLQPGDLGRWVEFTTTSGKPQGSTLWKALTHVVIHGAQFRAEAGAALAGFGHSPGDLDFLWYLRETDQR